MFKHNGLLQYKVTIPNNTNNNEIKVRRTLYYYIVNYCQTHALNASSTDCYVLILCYTEYLAYYVVLSYCIENY